VRAKGKIARTSPPARELLNGCTFDGLGDFNAQGRRWLHHVANFRIHGTIRAGELAAAQYSANAGRGRRTDCPRHVRDRWVPSTRAKRCEGRPTAQRRQL
jgi:hypothetical protein